MYQWQYLAVKIGRCCISNSYGLTKLKQKYNLYKKRWDFLKDYVLAIKQIHV